MSKAHVRQALAGMELPHDGTVPCASCGTRLSEGSPVTVAANRDGDRWRVAQIYGARCAPIEIEECDADPDALAEADLGMLVDTAAQQHSLALLSVVVLDALGARPPERPEVVEAWWDRQ